MSEEWFLVYKLTPPSEMKPEDFVRFVQEEVFSAVNAHPTRFGGIAGLHLLTTDATDEYFWVIKYSGLAPLKVTSDIADASRKLKSSGVLMSETPKVYNEVSMTQP